MKIHHQPWKLLAGLLAVALTIVGAVTSASAATLSLNGQVIQRPLTPTEIKSYGLTNAQFSGGIGTVGVGEPVYLDALVNYGVTSSNVLSVTWAITNKPTSSQAMITNSPLGTNVPIYPMAELQNNSGSPVSLLASRAFFRPDVSGSYTVLATITSKGTTHGTNIVPVSSNIVVKITAGTYYGAQICAACHSGNFEGVPNIYPSYTNTPHASFFTRAIDGLESSHYNASCIYCHVVGYDTNSFANNGGFDDMATWVGWTFPTVLTNGNWASMPPPLQNLANIQCENCHGPGSQHIFSGGSSNFISVSYGAGDCSQCHDSLTTHPISAQWNASAHAVTTRTPSGPNRPACVRCHTAPGFIGYINNLGNTNGYGTNTTYYAIACQTCHDPHDASNPHQLRTSTSITLGDGTVVTNAGAGGFCMNCHQSRNGSVTNSIVNYPQLKQTWQGGSSFGVHDSSQGDLLEGANAVTYGQVIPSSAHRYAVPDTCAGCHMQSVASTNIAFLQAGGHTFSMTYTNGAGETVDLVDVCVQCHGPIEDFNMVKVDYNGDGVIEGVQTEVQKLLDKLSTLLPDSTYQSNPSNYVADGLVKSPSVKTNWPTRFLNAAYNWQFVNADGSKGIHNAQYAVGILKASIGDLTGDANNDGLPDAWQISYFGSITNAAAAPNAINNTNGIPNWMMYALGLDPHSGGTAVNGVVYINSGNVINGTSNIVIYTAAEVVFNTTIGKTYTIQGITELTGNWQNISTNIVGTGSSISYLTPTRGNQQMFYRVVSTP